MQKKTGYVKHRTSDDEEWQTSKKGNMSNM